MQLDIRSAPKHRVRASPGKGAEVETIHISDALNVDLAPDGSARSTALSC